MRNFPHSEIETVAIMESWSDPRIMADYYSERNHSLCCTRDTCAAKSSYHVPGADPRVVARPSI